MGYSLSLFVAVIVAAKEPDMLDACIGDSESAQRLRREGDLLKARAAFGRCRISQCPKAIRADCLRWFDEVDASIPSVLILPREGGRDLLDANVTIDGQALPLDGQPVEVNPGPHEVVVKRKGEQSKSVPLVAAASEKNRRLVVEFTPAPPKDERSAVTPSEPVVVAAHPVTTAVSEGVTSKVEVSRPYSAAVRAETRGSGFSRAPVPMLGLTGIWRFAVAQLGTFLRGPANEVGFTLGVGVRLPIVSRLDVRLLAEALAVAAQPISFGAGASGAVTYAFTERLSALVGGGVSWAFPRSDISQLNPFLSVALEWRFLNNP
jgi:hypothetical protein